MRKDIFVRGEGMKGRVILQGTSVRRDKEYYTFAGEDGKPVPGSHVVVIGCDGKKTFFDSCTCEHCSIHDGVSQVLHKRVVLCKHKIAVIKALPLVEVNESDL